MPPLMMTDHPTHEIRQQLEFDYLWHPCSVEYLNYALAILIFSVRYSSVFWSTSKAFSLVFSIALVANGVQSLVFFPTMSIMHSVQVTGPQHVLRNYKDLLLPSALSLFLYLLSSTLVLLSST